MANIDALLADIRKCSLCAEQLPRAPRPVVQASSVAKILIAGQAPGRKVQESGVPFDDASGQRLRAWLGIDEATFYDSKKVAIVPMGFCYPGTGKSGDLPPRPECAKTWRASLLSQLESIELTLVIGQYAMRYHLPQASGSLTETVKAWQAYWPAAMPLPHPSPRNNRWLKHNLWFEEQVLPALQERVRGVFN